MHILWHESADEAAYEAARLSRVFNQRSPARFPLGIAKPTNESDIIAAIKLALQCNCRIAVRAGGHSFPVWSVQDHSILLDLGNFKVLEVDEAARSAKVSPSITSKELNDVLIEKHGLMFPGGHCPDVGLGGFLLQGGMGWNCRNWGWACESVEAIKVVTMQGESVFCNSQQNADLYWAARGAGPAFPAVVTEFHLRLIPYPKNGFRSSGYIYPRNRYREAFSWVLEITPTVDTDTEITVVTRYMEGQADVCVCVYFVCMKTTPEEAEAALHYIHTQQSRPSDTLTEWYCREDSLENLYDKQAKANPKGHRYHTDSAYIHNDADVVTVLEDAFLGLPRGKSFAFWSAMNPWSRRQLPDMALSMRSDHYFAIYALSEDIRDDVQHQSWVHKVMKTIENHSVGTYLGDSDLQKMERYWDSNHARYLMEICDKWDPKSVMCRYQPRRDELETKN
ncbi:FAD-binding domain-containing protein [Aspergillus steynii IBT 23096]|uniref:FAD-binding domain-containing protein n=1 Tax=Aspergillus steynii IBT 23096 TaxID=1392250 RepID=A0A2I2FUV3_9EURO|nr:FAD-binding domain-containing protein [Aspergillus steynii IBT 23096]PLB44419.1 FAD-binding domain-containing protein [Aspergillus steynii IBT 23096]